MAIKLRYCDGYILFVFKYYLGVRFIVQVYLGASFKNVTIEVDRIYIQCSTIRKNNKKKYVGIGTFTQTMVML